MTPTKIIVKNGYGRPENPHERYIPEILPTKVSTQEWIDFEATVKSMPVVGEVEDGVYMAQLCMQRFEGVLHKYRGLQPDRIIEEWWTTNSDATSIEEYLSENPDFKFPKNKLRQAYRIIQADEKAQLVKRFDKGDIDSYNSGYSDRTSEIKAIIEGRLEDCRLIESTEIKAYGMVEIDTKCVINELNHILKEISK